MLKTRASLLVSLVGVAVGAQSVVASTFVVVRGDIDKFDCEPGWTPTEGSSGCDLSSLPLVGSGEVFLSDEDATDVRLNQDDNNLTLTFNFSFPLLAASAAYIEFWGLDIEARASATNTISLDGSASLNSFALTQAPGGSDDYVTLTRYDLHPAELTRLGDGSLVVVLFLPAPGGGGDGIAFDFARLVVEGQSIPTVSTWGLAVMVLLLLSAGTLVMTRRRAMT